MGTVQPATTRPMRPTQRPIQEPWAGPLDFASIYDAFFHEACRWARALGVNDGEVEDVAQEVFVAVQRRLPEFKNENLAGWLYRITVRAARDHRQRAWFRHLVGLRRPDDLEAYERKAPGAADQLADLRLLHRLLEGMSEKKRVTLVLYELEGYTGEEIAALHDVPIDTVWSRLRHARNEMKERLEWLRQKGEL